MLYERQFASVIKESIENKLTYFRIVLLFGNVRVTNVTK